MRNVADAQERLEVARDLPEILAASYSAFDQLLVAVRQHEERAEGLFAAFVMAAASAADGRDALTSAPTLPAPLPGISALARAAQELGGAASIDDVADELAHLSELLMTQLNHAASQAAREADQTALAEAARCAAAVNSLLARPEQ